MFVLPIIQARTNSSRLPGKILKPFSTGLNTIDYVACALKAAGLDRIVLATTDQLADDLLAKTYQDRLQVYRGSENNVLSRYTDVICKYQPDYVVRICADNPLLLEDGIRYLLDQIPANPRMSYLSFALHAKPSMKLPFGIFAELIKAQALLDVAKSPTQLEVEHVTISLYDPGRNDFKLFDFEKVFFPVPADLRFTIDTQTDFDNVEAVLKKFPDMKFVDAPTLKRIVEFVSTSEMIETMRLESSKSINSKNYSAGGNT